MRPVSFGMIEEIAESITTNSERRANDLPTRRRRLARYARSLNAGGSAKKMKDELQIEWPWTMTWSEYVDELIDQIKEALPPDHELRKHDLFPGIKWDGRPIYIIDDVIRKVEGPRVAHRILLLDKC